jgi:hypothetical protein
MNNTKATLENGGVAGPASSSLEAVARCIPSTGIDFGYCSVSLETHRIIKLENIVPRSVQGQSIRYTIETDSTNFSLSHSNGKCVLKST